MGRRFTIKPRGSGNGHSEENLPDAASGFLGFLHGVQRMPAVQAVNGLAGPAFGRQYWHRKTFYLEITVGSQAIAKVVQRGPICPSALFSQW